MAGSAAGSPGPRRVGRPEAGGLAGCVARMASYERTRCISREVGCPGVDSEVCSCQITRWPAVWVLGVEAKPRVVCEPKGVRKVSKAQGAFACTQGAASLQGPPNFGASRTARGVRPRGCLLNRAPYTHPRLVS